MAWYRQRVTIDEARASQTTEPETDHRLYPTLLGASWDALHPAVQLAHTVPGEAHASGTFRVGRGPGFLTGWLLDLARVPPSSPAIDVRLAIQHRGLSERWHRAFDGAPLVTYQSAAPGGVLAERVGPLEFRFRLAVRDGSLLYRQVGFAICLGPLRIPLPEWAAITIACREGAAPPVDPPPMAEPRAAPLDRTTVDVRVTAPTGTLLFAYRGTVRWGVQP